MNVKIPRDLIPRLACAVFGAVLGGFFTLRVVVSDPVSLLDKAKMESLKLMWCIDGYSLPLKGQITKDVVYCGDTQSELVARMQHVNEGMSKMGFPACDLSRFNVDKERVLDPWQEPYVVAIDGDGDKSIELEVADLHSRISIIIKGHDGFVFSKGSGSIVLPIGPSATIRTTHAQ